MKRIKSIINFIIKKNKIEEIPLDLIINKQYSNNEFMRLDIIVRYLAIEDEKGINNYGWDLYKKMQIIRCANKKTKLNVDDRIEKFKKLINSWDKDGYNGSLVTLDKNYCLIDGSHRLALCLFYSQNVINCKILNTNNSSYYGEKWFISNCFTDDELKIINNKASKLL